MRDSIAPAIGTAKKKKIASSPQSKLSIAREELRCVGSGAGSPSGLTRAAMRSIAALRPPA
jgi:hypothetical protein